MNIPGVTTLDGRLRALALAQARKEFKAASSSFLNFKGGRSTPICFMSLHLKEGSYTPSMLVARIEEVFIDQCGQTIGDAAVKEFMAKVDNLSTEVGEIRNMVEDLPHE